MASSADAGDRRRGRSAASDRHRSRGRGGAAEPGRHPVGGEPRAGAAEEPDEYRTAFERDRDRIIHSKAFRRLKHKTQVFLNPEGDHFVTRLTHTMQVTQVARSLAAALEPERAAGRGDRARPRRRPLPVRAHRRGRPVAVLPAGRLAPRRAERPDLGGARGREPDLGGARRDPGALVEDRAAAGDAGGVLRPLRRSDRLPRPRRARRAARRRPRPGRLSAARSSSASASRDGSGSAR